MRSILLLLLLAIGGALRAQVIPFIQTAHLEQWKTADSDTVYVLNFWATWCAPCVKELPAFEQLHANYAGKKVKVVLISTDFRRNVESHLIPFVHRNNLQSEVVFLDERNPNNYVDLINPEWSGAIPATLIVNRRKNLERFHEGSLNYEALEALLKSAL